MLNLLGRVSAAPVVRTDYDSIQLIVQLSLCTIFIFQLPGNSQAPLVQLIAQTVQLVLSSQPREKLSVLSAKKASSRAAPEASDVQCAR